MSSDDFPRKPPAQLDMQQVREQARLLRRRQGWDPKTRTSEDPREAMRRLNQARKNDEIYAQQEQSCCEACAQARADSDDETALCPTHLAEAMGF